MNSNHHDTSIKFCFKPINLSILELEVTISTLDINNVNLREGFLFYI